MIFPADPPISKCQAKYRRISTASTTKNKQRLQQQKMAKRPAQTPEKPGATKRRIIELDDLFEPNEQRAQQQQPTSTPNRSGGGGGNQQPINGAAAAAANNQQAMALVTQQHQQQTLNGGGGGLQAMALVNQQLPQQILGGGGGGNLVATGGGGQFGRVRSLAEIEQLNQLKKEIEDRKKATEKSKQPPGLDLLDEFGPNGLTSTDVFWCGWNDKHLFPRLRLKLATFYASMISLERIGETAVTNAQLTNGELVITVYGWDKQAQFLNNALNGQEGKIVEMKSLVPKDNKSARSMLSYRLLFTGDSHIEIVGNPEPDMTVATTSTGASTSTAASSSAFESDQPCTSASLYTTPPSTPPRPPPRDVPSRDLHFARELQSVLNSSRRPAGNIAANKAKPSGEQQQSKKLPTAEVIDLAGEEDENEEEMEEFTDAEEGEWEQMPPEQQNQEFMQKEAKAPPLSEYKIRRLTRNAWVHEDELEEEEKERADHCSICQDVEVDRTAVELPCAHRYHRHCGLKWLRECGNCPLCRKVPRP